MEVAMNRRVIEVHQRRIEAAHGPAEALEQLWRARADLGEGNAFEVGHQANEVRRAGRETDRLAGNRRQHARADRKSVV